MRTLLTLLLLIPFLVFAQGETEDLINFKNGSSIRGTIILNLEGQPVQILTNSGVKVFEQNEIQSIQKDVPKLKVIPVQQVEQVQPESGTQSGPKVTKSMAK